MKKWIIGTIGCLVIIATSATKAFAVCPVCTVAVAGALVLLERWGVDNTISGIWIGALLMSMTMWTGNWLRSKKIEIPLLDIWVGIAYYVITIIPLWWKNIIGLPSKTIWGYDKVLVGVVIGSLIFLGSEILYLWFKKKNNDHPWFPFQKVAMPIVFLVFPTIIFYFITR